MTARILVELPGGSEVLFGGDAVEAGLRDVAAGLPPARATADKFKAALESLRALVATLEESVGQMTKRPEKVEMEFGVSLSGDCNLWIVSGEGKAEIKVKLSWGKGG